MVDDTPHTPGEQTVPLSELVEELKQEAPPGEQGPASKERSDRASGDTKATAAPSALDDPRSIEDGPETVRRVALGYKPTIEQLEKLMREGRKVEISPVDGLAYELLPVSPRDHAAGRSQRGSPEQQDKKPEPEPPVDRAGGVPQQGTFGDPDPRSRNSGMLASEIAAVAFGTVQSYKKWIGQDSRYWSGIGDFTRAQITAFVRSVMSEGVGGPAANHEVWRKNMIEAGVTLKDDPRVGQAWGDMEPVERRKSMIFTQVVMALLREV